MRLASAFEPSEMVHQPSIGVPFTNDVPADYNSTTSNTSASVNLLITNGAQLPSGAWDHFILQIVSIIEDEDVSPKVSRCGLVDWIDGSKTMHPLYAFKRMCPVKLLDFYEERMVFGSPVNFPVTDDLVENVHTIFEESSEEGTERYVLLEMKEGDRFQKPLKLARRECPQKLLEYFEAKMFTNDEDGK